MNSRHVGKIFAFWGRNDVPGDSEGRSEGLSRGEKGGENSVLHFISLRLRLDLVLAEVSFIKIGKRSLGEEWGV